MKPCLSVSVLVLCLSGLLAGQISVTIPAAKDNTLFEAPTGFLSNGAGAGIYCGVTSSNLIRRGLMSFDVAGSIPAGARITAVTLTLEVTQINTFNPLDLDVGLHAVLADWGEAGSNSTMVGGGGGTFAQPGDATWIHTFTPGQFWTSPGGDFAPTPSAVTTVGITLGPVSWSGPGLVADVQAFLDQPTQNFGWMLKAPENEVNNAKRFATREHPTPSIRPQLQVSFVPYPGSNDDLQIRTGVGGPPLDFAPQKSANEGQVVALRLESPLGSYVGTPPMVAAQIAPSGMLPWKTPFYPELQIDFSTGVYYEPVILYSGLASSGNVSTLPFVGLTATGPIPIGLTGFDIVLQGFCFAPSGVTGNPWFTTTDAHLITIL